MTYPELFHQVGLRLPGSYSITAQSWNHHSDFDGSRSVDTTWRITWFAPGDYHSCSSVTGDTAELALAALDEELHAVPAPTEDPTGVGELGGVISAAEESR